MQIPEDADSLPVLRKNPQRRVATIEELALQNSRQDDTVRLPLSAIAFWREPENPELDTVRVRLDLPESVEDEVTVAAFLPDSGD
jgi:hypothetical protein